MSSNPFHPDFDRLPDTLPLFPLSGAVVMPGCQLPLNIFEPRYLNMVFDAMAGERLIGMVQIDAVATGANLPALYQIGTAGRIVSFSETKDGRLLIVLSGVCRYRITGEIPTTRGYRRATVDWSDFRSDYDTEQVMAFPRERLELLLREYFAVTQLEIDWDALIKLEDLMLCNLLVGALPWEPAERQTLMEAVSLDERIERLVGLLRFAVAPTAAGSAATH
jgi:Lon protease-like protein